MKRSQVAHRGGGADPKRRDFRDRRQASRRTLTAYHEAGHAVVAVVLRIPIDQATIVPDHDESSAGQVILAARWTESLSYSSGNRKHAAYATQSMAGVMALALWRHDRAAMFDELRQERHDWGNVVDAAIAIVGPGGDATTFYRRARLRAERLLRAHWPAVERVAAALRDCQTLQGPVVRALVRG